MKSATQKRKLTTKKQDEFIKFVNEKVMPLFEKRNEHFDCISPALDDSWSGTNILITIPYGERMEPWLKKVIKECWENEEKAITVIMGAKVNTNAWHNYVFPFADEIGFVRRGKRPTAYAIYKNKLDYSAFAESECLDITITYSLNYHGEKQNFERVTKALSREIIDSQE